VICISTARRLMKRARKKFRKSAYWNATQPEGLPWSGALEAEFVANWVEILMQGGGENRANSRAWDGFVQSIYAGWEEYATYFSRNGHTGSRANLTLYNGS
jgi:hypothetical protein